MSRADTFEQQATALFNLVPSTWDVFNFTVVEGMASARPTIVSTGAGACDLVVDGENGFIFTSENANDLASCIERVLSSTHDRLNEIGRAGRDTISKLLDPNKIAGERIANYKRRIEAFRCEPAPTPSAWLRDIVRPTGGIESALEFLYSVPLRGILGHTLSRLLERLRRK
jgi:hypothetical protein